MTRLALALTFLVATTVAAQDPSQGEALREAARQGDLAGVTELLDAGVSVDAATRYGTTALFYAADRGYLDVVRFLVERGADVGVTDTFYNSSVLARALAANRLGVARFLLANGATDGNAAIITAARTGDRRLLELAIATENVHAEALAAATEAARDRNDEAALAVLAEVVPAPDVAPIVERQLLGRYSGVYQSDFLRQNVEVGVAGQQLTVRIARDPVRHLVAVSESSFETASGELRVSFVGRGGMIERLVVVQDGNTESYRPIGETESREAAPVGIGDVVSGVLPPANPRDPPAPWPSFRGQNASGIADGQGAPARWDVASGENIAWKTAIPGFANAGPVIWGDRVFITTAISSSGDDTFRIGQYGDIRPVDDLSEHSWWLYSLDRRTGDVLWEREVYVGAPETKRHTKASQANSTPVTDGQHVIAVFGAIGLVVCYDMDGTLLWDADIGALHSGWFIDPDFQWGHSSSPVIHDELVIIQADTSDEPFLVALDLRTGDEVWRVRREDEISTFATPTVYSGPEGDELITNGTRIRAYDPATGEPLWSLGPNSEIPIATPVIHDGLIYLTAGYPPVRPIYVVRPGHRGDLSLRDGEDSNAAVVWSKDRGGTYIPTPLVYDGYLYTNANNGRLTCYDAKTGDIVYRRRIGGVGGSYSASPIAADGKLYFASEDGDVYVVRAGPEYEVLARNSMDEIIMANPAVSDGVMVIRTLHHVYGVAE